MAGAADNGPAPGKIPALGMLPDGSKLKRVMLPRYDDNHQLVGSLKADVVTLVNASQIAGQTVAIEFFNPDQSGRGRIDMENATYYQDQGLVTTKNPVAIITDRVTAHGSGLYYSFNQTEGFLAGPATTIILAPAETTMNPSNKTLRATALVGTALLTQPLAAAPPPAVTPAEIAAIQADAVSKAPAAATAANAARTALDADLAKAAAAGEAATKFTAQSGLPAVATDEVPPPSQPLVVKPGAGDTVITCTGGIYFDPDEGVLVYLKNVTVKDPRFDLSGANELKVFFGKKPELAGKKDAPKPPKPADDAKPKLGGNIGANFNEVERIVATGAVLLDQKNSQPGKEPIKASGSIFTYNIKADQVTIKGGYPWVLQGKTYMRAKEPNLILRISPNAGSFITEGNWEMGGNIEQKKKP